MDNSLIKRFINGVCRAWNTDPDRWERERDVYTDIGFRAGYYHKVHHHNEEEFFREFIRFWYEYIRWRYGDSNESRGT